MTRPSSLQGKRRTRGRVGGQQSQPRPRARTTTRGRTKTRKMPQEPEDEDRFFVIEKLLEKRFNRELGYEEYLVRWQNYTSEWDTWEPRHEIEKNALDMILEFNRIQRNDLGESEDDDDRLHCICQRPYRFENGGMIQCYNCYTWYHFNCIKMDMEEANLYCKYYCDPCRRNNPMLKNMVKPEKHNTFSGKELADRLKEEKF